tara:strand:+ start:914 stop:1297 length:384 start_codon:yes stop_codon:yes gene_type:complete
MIDFEKQINNARIKEDQVVNEDEFLYKLEMRLRHSKDSSRILMVSVMMLIAVFTLTITQYGAPSNLETMFAVNDVENILETDFWNINGDSLNNYDSYFSDMALFLLEEGFVWETYELLNEFEQEREI